MKKQYIKLTDVQRKTLKDQQIKGVSKVRVQKRIIALLELDKGQTQAAVASIINQSTTSISKLVKRFELRGLKCIYDEQRPGRPIAITAEQRDKITVLACEEAPEGHSQWSLRLLADKVVELGYCEEISHTKVWDILRKKTQTASDKNLVYRNNKFDFSV